MQVRRPRMGAAVVCFLVRLRVPPPSHSFFPSPLPFRTSTLSQSLLGPFPNHMLQNGRDVPKYFTNARDGTVYERSEDGSFV
jgi:hypothetical protein